jgi:hypothetical protein
VADPVSFEGKSGGWQDSVSGLADVVYQSFNLEVGILAHGYFPLDGAA